MKGKGLSAWALGLFLASLVAAQNGPDSDPDGARGYVDNVFHHSEVDSINAYNGQLTIPIALGPAYPIGPKLKFQAMLTYTSSVWEHGNPDPNNYDPNGLWQPIKADPALGVGWTFTLGAIKPCGIGQNFRCYVGPDGSERKFEPYPSLGYYKPTDASPFYFHDRGASGWEMWDGDGNHYVFGWPVTGYDDPWHNYIHDLGRGRNGWYLTSLTDPFGNGISVTYYGGLGAASPCWTSHCPTAANSWIVRTVQRTRDAKTLLTVNLGSDLAGISNLVMSFDVAVAAGLTARWSLRHGSVNVTRAAPNATSLNLVTLTAIQLPATPTPEYAFSYNDGRTDNSFGGLVRTMTLPTSGVISYVWGGYHFYHGRTSSISQNCLPIGPPNDAEVKQTGRAAAGQRTNRPERDAFPEPHIPGPGCTDTNRNRWLDVSIGVMRRTETVGGVDAVTDYAQWAFPFGEQGSLSNNIGPQTLTLVTYPADVDGHRTATSILFWGVLKGSKPFGGEPGDRTGADIRIATFDHDPYPGFLLPFPQPLCGGVADSLCVTHAVRVKQRTFEYDDPTSEAGNRRLKQETTWYGPTNANGSCPSCNFHTVSFSNSPGRAWEGNGRHFNLETHSGNLSNDSRTTTTNWTPSTTPWLPNLHDRRTATDGASTVDRYFEFTAGNGFPRGSFLFDATRKRVFLTCRYDSDGRGDVDQEFSATYTSWPGYPAPPSANACSQFYPSSLASGVGINGDAFGKDFTHQNGQLLTERWMRNPTTPASWYSRRYIRDAATGWVTSSFDTAGLATTYQHDGLGRVIRITPPGEAATAVAYPSAVQTAASRSGGTGLSTFHQYDYDGLGRLIRERKLLPAGQYAKRFTKYDGRGNAFFKSEWVSDAAPETVTATLTTSCAFASGAFSTKRPPAAPGTWSLCYDPFGRPQAVVGPMHASLTTINRTDNVTPNIPYSDTRAGVTVGCLNGSYSSSGNCAGGTDSTTATRWDAFGRITRVSEPGGDLTDYTYDVNDKVKTVAQGSQARRFVHDPAGLLRSETTPEGGAVSYDSYGSLGNLLKETRPGGLVLNRSHDFAGRLLGVTSNEGGSRIYLANVYDAGGAGSSSGKLTSRTAYNFAVAPAPAVFDSYIYGGVGGRLSSQTTTVTNGASLSASQSWTYNSLGLLATRSHPRASGSFSETFTFDAGLPIKLTAGGQTVLSSVTYHSSEAIASYTTGNGVKTTLAPDVSTLPRVGRISTSGTSGGSFDTGPFVYDGGGNIKSMGADGFAYDTRSRLTMANFGALGAQDFAYDRHGNLIRKGATNYSVSASTNRLLTAAYDARGNLTAGGSETLTYDGLNRQIRLQAPGIDWKYLFDGAGERVARVPVSGAATHTFRDEANRVVTEYVGTVLGRDNIYLGHVLVGSYVSSTLSGTLGWQFYASDHLGSPRLVTNLAAQVVEGRKYWPYGEGVAANPGTMQRVRFCAMERDSESNRYYDHARTHDFDLGRFLSPDKVGGRVQSPQTWNRYSYTLNNPMKHLDPDGNVVVATTGLGNKPSGIGLIVKQVSNVPGIGEARLFRHQDLDKALAFVLQAHAKNPNEPVITVGHSRGVDTNVFLAYELAKRGIPVNLMIAIDPAIYDKKLSFNVREAYGYYQTQTWPGGRQLVASSPSTKVSNMEVLGTRHGDIDNDLANARVIARQIIDVWQGTIRPAPVCGEPDFIGPCQ